MDISVKGNESIRFNNNVDFCVGTGRLGLALTEEYLKELEFVQREIGFKFIRGHGLFTDDVAIYQEYEENGEVKTEYNYTYIDRIIDSYIRLGIRPYLELGFMPEKMATGEQTIFYWKGNVTPPKDHGKWTDMVIALLAHLKERYGEEVVTWPIEVWNEPNLPGFWKDADMEAYFRLFKETFCAIKAYDSRFMVGGPAICGVKDAVWIKAFLDFCLENDLEPDIITRHHYTVEFPERIGHYDYSKLQDPDERMSNLQCTRDIIDSFDRYRGKPIHITEFSTSYTPRGVIHDTNLNAAYIAEQLSRLGDMNESYSYWTFGDVFEEVGVPFSLFHGGFGLCAANNIPKPTLWTFAFYKKLKDKTVSCVYKGKNAVICRTEKGYAGVMWNTDSEDIVIGTELGVPCGEYSLLTNTVDEKTCNPLKVWHDLGEPAYPKQDAISAIRSAAFPAVDTAVVKPENGKAEITFTVRKNGVVYFELAERSFTPDRGYDYEKVISFR